MARKRYQGKFNDRERSTGKLVQAVGIVIKEKGYTGLTATNIAKAAGLDRRLISLYFDSIDQLIETYIKGKDYWVAAAKSAKEIVKNNPGKNSREILEVQLLNQLDDFYGNREMQKIVLWQLSEHTDIMHQVCMEREKLSQAFFALSDKELKDKNMDLRAITALLVGGIYSLVLHAKGVNSLFCEIDLNSPEGKERLKNALRLVLKQVYTCGE